MRIAVVGGGLTGMSAALALAEGGAEVMLYEADRTLGGVAGSFEVHGTKLEKFYHHIFTSDTAITALIERLGLGASLEWRPTTTSYYAEAVYRLATPLDVIRFRPLPFVDRIRMGLLVFQARFVGDWRDLEAQTSREWLIAKAGRRVYDTVWGPMLRGKFGTYADEVSAVWIWNKLKLRGGSRGRAGQEVLGYLRGGFGLMIDALEARLRSLGVAVHTASPVRSIDKGDGDGYSVTTAAGPERFDEALVTTAPPLFAAMVPWMPQDYITQLHAIQYLANVCAVLELKESLSDVYWLNISDNRIPFVGLVEHTNLQRPDMYGGAHLVYLTRYCTPDDAYYRMGDAELAEAYVPHLQRLFPRFRPDWIRHVHVWRERYAQPLTARHYSELRPAFRSPEKGLWLCSMPQIYPEDRGMNYAVDYGAKVAREILSSGGK
ncbi:MAG: NAD(P)/FAD-dependent oxidoreductase [Anaerolineae bacterium]